MLVWNETYSVGSDLLDSEHRVLISLFTQLIDALETGQSREIVGSILNVLCDVGDDHFKTEERVLIEIGYPDREAHCADHITLMERCNDLRNRYHAGERGVLQEDTVRFLGEWLTRHIALKDIQYRPWVVRAEANKNGDGPAPGQE